jgi:hypothetical protein
MIYPLALIAINGIGNVSKKCDSTIKSRPITNKVPTKIQSATEKMQTPELEAIDYVH